MGNSKSKIQPPIQDPRSRLSSPIPQHHHHHHGPETSCRLRRTLHKALGTLGGPKKTCKVKPPELPRKSLFNFRSPAMPSNKVRDQQGDRMMREAEVIDLVTDSEDEDDVRSIPRDSVYPLAQENFVNLEDSPTPHYHPPRAQMHGGVGNANNFYGTPPQSHGFQEDFYEDGYDAAFAELITSGFDNDMNIAHTTLDNLHSVPEMGFEQRDTIPQEKSKGDVVDEVFIVFPDICGEYVAQLFSTVSKSTQQIIEHILNQIEKGTEYPKARDKARELKSLKRKRVLEEDEEAINKYGSIDRPLAGYLYARTVRAILSGDFSTIPMTFIDAALKQSRQHLFPAYRILEEAERTWDIQRPPYNKIKHARKVDVQYLPGSIEKILVDSTQPPEVMIALHELQAARMVRKKGDDKRRAEQQAIRDEEENIKRAEREGTMGECGCCFGEFPMNRMVHCNSDFETHWFCRGCAKKTAEGVIGESKYQLICMSMDGCDATFSKAQRENFLEETDVMALDRNESEQMLRNLGIENLASCPFCPFAAECPPIEEDRLFRCLNEDCEKVSCRLCKLDSHIPKTCEEFSKENGLSIRRQIEEAMSAALIRKCNKCGTPFVKEEGCNKMTCTRGGCFNVQCYVCSKSCGYDHFDDRNRGGKAGNCPLFESVEARHDQEVAKAEKDALAKARAEHPEYTDDDLRIKVSESVRKDEERRRGVAADPRRRVQAQNRMNIQGRLALNNAPFPPGAQAFEAGVINLLPFHPGPMLENMGVFGDAAIGFRAGVGDLDGAYDRAIFGVEIPQAVHVAAPNYAEQLLQLGEGALLQAQAQFQQNMVQLGNAGVNGQPQMEVPFQILPRPRAHLPPPSPYRAARYEPFVPNQEHNLAAGPLVPEPQPPPQYFPQIPNQGGAPADPMLGEGFQVNKADQPALVPRVFFQQPMVLVRPQDLLNQNKTPEQHARHQREVEQLQAVFNERRAAIGNAFLDRLKAAAAPPNPPGENNNPQAMPVRERPPWRAP